jgi:hypothetical protein
MLMRLLLALTVLLALAPAASAATLTRSGGTITFTAGAGEANDVNAGRSFVPEAWTVRSETWPGGGPIEPSLGGADGCTWSAGVAEVACTFEPAVTQWVLLGGDQADNLNSFWAAARIEGGDGDDQIDAGSQNDILLGGAGDEIWIKGDDGPDQIDGGPGSDRLYPGDGTDADDVRGGPGTDEVTYQDNSDTAPVSVTLDDVANDGRPGALGNVHSDVEDIMGGGGDDFLQGDVDNNHIRGDRPSFMQDGDDILDGGLGRDILDGGDGNDEIRARDGVADDVLCGPGTDTAIVDTIDLVTDCETVDASAELEPDRDGDGFAVPADCDDHDAAIRPGVVDVPENGIDEDCTGGDFVILDRDADGVGRPADCNDDDPRVRPGLAEIPGNAVDEDCSGAAAPFRRLSTEITSRWKVTARGTASKRLLARAVPRGAEVVLRCRGKGCPKPKTVRQEIRKRKDVKLHPLLAGRRLKPGATVQVRITLPQAIGTVTTFTVRDGKVPSRRSRCLPPGAKKPSRCA